jgi:glycosyltransferase involved in cell wall biosynthesis
MHFILHADLDEDPIADGFAPPRRSYYSVLNALRPAFESLGSVDVVFDPNTEVDPIFDRCVASNVECIFFSFSAPHKVPLGLRCPTAAVLVWEYSTIPTEIWDRAGRSDWRVTLAALGRAVTVCNYTARVIKKAMGEDFPVHVIPVAVWDRFETARSKYLPGHAAKPAEFHVNGIVLDSALLELSADSLVPAARPPSVTDDDTTRAARAATLGLTSPPPSNIKVRLDGIVYTATFSPSDERKNLYDFLTAFCFAFRDIEDATLVIRIVHWDKNNYHGPLFWELSRLSPFKCRVVFVQARLDEEAAATLMAAASYYVNVSHCEAVGLSLMEFMSCGRPAIAARHTAMEDYIDQSVAFLVDFSRESSAWPQDPRMLFRCDRFRMDWESLRDAFLESYRVITEEPERHRVMGQRAMERMHELTATDAVAEKLRAFLSGRVADTGYIDSRRAGKAP